jgi:hypothetical protein
MPTVSFVFAGFRTGEFNEQAGSLFYGLGDDNRCNILSGSMPKIAKSSILGPPARDSDYRSLR